MLRDVLAADVDGRCGRVGGAGIDPPFACRRGEPATGMANGVRECSRRDNVLACLTGQLREPGSGRTPSRLLLHACAGVSRRCCTARGPRPARVYPARALEWMYRAPRAHSDSDTGETEIGMLDVRPGGSARPSNQVASKCRLSHERTVGGPDDQTRRCLTPSVYLLYCRFLPGNYYDS
jgi:hypothetical protein